MTDIAEPAAEPPAPSAINNAARAHMAAAVPVAKPKLRLIDDWKTELHRLWSIRVALAYAAFTGMAMILGAFVDVFNPWFLLVVSEVVCISIVLLRLVKQKDPMEPIA